MYMQNPAVGDIVIVRQPAGEAEEMQTGDHLTLDRLDMTVPIMFRGLIWNIFIICRICGLKTWPETRPD